MAMEGKGGGGGDLSTIYVGDLNPEVSENHLYEKFGQIGPVAGVHVCRDSITRRSLGYAYVNYFSQIDAQQALDRLNYSDIRGRPCRIMWSKRERPFKASPDANIFVKNLAPSIDSRSLSDTFSMFGAILSCKVSTGANGASRGYGFVQYESEDAAKQAIERVNGMLIGGKKVFVGPFKKREQQQQESADDCSLFVRNIPENWEDGDVLKLFEPFGELFSHMIMNDTRVKKRHGFVNFKDPEAAEAAIAALNGKDTRTEDEIAQAEKEKEAGAGDDKQDEKEAGKEEDKKESEEAKEEGAEGEAKKESKGKDRQPSYCLLVGKAKSKAERDAEQRSRQDKKEDRFEGIKLHVRNLTTDMKEPTLRELFEPFGTVTDVKVVQDRETGLGKGYGFVRFATMEEAKKAVEGMHLKEGLQVGLAGQKGEGREGKGERRGKGEGKGKGKSKGKDNFPQPMMGYPQQQPPMYYPPMPGAGGFGAPRGPLLPPMYPMMGAPQMMGIRPGMPGMPGMSPGMPMMPMGMPRPGFPAQPVPATLPPQMPPGTAPPQQPPAAQAGQPGQINAATLAQMEPAKRKQVLGEHLFPLVVRQEPDLAGKITGMLLEVPDQELLAMLQSPPILQKKVAEAVDVLKQKMVQSQA